jgi:serine protease Do
MIARILIKHVAGSKANRIEQFQLDGAHELTIGRGPAANVAFDGLLDDTVSRRHAIIKIMRSDRLSFRIADLGSSNGVRVNGKPIWIEQNLLPDDVVELSPGGPAFRIAVEPESLYRADEPKTRRMWNPHQDGAGFTGKASEQQAPVAREVAQPRSRVRSSRLALWTTLVAVGVGAGALSNKSVLYYGRSWMVPRSQTSASGTTNGRTTGGQAAGAAPAAAPTPAAAVAIAPVPSLPPGASEKPAATPSAAIVYLGARWRLYDTFTGKPVFQKTVIRKGQRLPCFVELDDDRIVSWLTTEDEEHTNSPIGGVIQGTGFIISDRGSIITSRRIAAGWTVPYHRETTSEHRGVLFHIQDGTARETPGATIDLTAPENANRLIDWIPGNGAFLFRSRYPVQLGAAKNDLEGRNDLLSVQLPFSHAGTPARLIRASADADVAELKVDVDRQLPVIALAPDTAARVGERIRTQGYVGSPDTSLDQAAAIDAPEIARLEGRMASPPELTSAEGTIISMDATTAFPDAAGFNAARNAGNGPSDGIYQLSVQAAHPADGAPVLDDDGKALGVVAYDTIGTTAHLYAYSISFVRALLQAQ